MPPSVFLGVDGFLLEVVVLDESGFLMLISSFGLAGLIVNLLDLHVLIVGHSYKLAQKVTQFQQGILDYSEFSCKGLKGGIGGRNVEFLALFFEFAEELVLEIEHFDKLEQLVIDFLLVLLQDMEFLLNVSHVQLPKYMGFPVVPALEIGEQQTQFLNVHPFDNLFEFRTLHINNQLAIISNLEC